MTRNLLKYILITLILFASHFGVLGQSFTETERTLILSAEATVPLPILLVTDSVSYQTLTQVSTDIAPQDTLIAILKERMYQAMRDPANPGVGIAAPQVGINKRLIWVQRFDKAGEPFEFYINPKIVDSSAIFQKGPEGCLSIPDIRGDVYRYSAIDITYQLTDGSVQTEKINGFTAVIFQHEIDHLEGKLFTQRMQEQALLNFKHLYKNLYQQTPKKEN